MRAEPSDTAEIIRGIGTKLPKLPKAGGLTLSDIDRLFIFQK